MGNCGEGHFIFCRRTCFLSLLMLGLAIIYALPTASVVWATRGQNALRQTVPTVTPTPIPSWSWAASYVDYSPSGVPDFDQKQGEWRDPLAPQIWTHCGPLALANVLWWLDSRLEPDRIAPPEVSDGHVLLSSFGSWDDHDARNVAPLVDYLASRLETNVAVKGTEISAFIPASQSYLVNKGLQETYSITVTASPSFEQLFQWVQQGDGVVLLLGFWEWQGDQWVYLGGHYVALAGAEPANRLIAISDPFRDAFEAGKAWLGRSPVVHSYPHAASAHNDAQYVSHDAYPVVATEGPGGAYALVSYAQDYNDVQNFVGQNLASTFEPYRGYYGGAVLTTKMDYALIISYKRTFYTLYLPIVLKGARWSP